MLISGAQNIKGIVVLLLYFTKKSLSVVGGRPWCLFFRLAEDDHAIENKERKKYVIKLHHHAQTKYSKVRARAYS